MPRWYIWVAIGLAVAIAVLISIGFIHAVKPIAKLYTWVRDCPDPALYSYQERILFKATGTRILEWGFDISKDHKWLGYKDAAGYHVYQASSDMETKDWQPLPLLSITRRISIRGFACSDTNALLLYRDLDLKRYFFAVLEYKNTEMWKSVALPQSYKRCENLQLDESGENVLLTRLDANGHYYFTCLPISDLSNQTTWTSLQFPFDRVADCKMIVGQGNIIFAYSTKENGLQYSYYKRGAAGCAQSIASHAVSDQTRPGSIRLAMIDGKPAIAHHSINTGILTYFRCKVAEPQSEDDWNATIAYKAHSFGWPLLLFNWEQRPAMIVPDLYGDMLLVAKTSMPRKPQDWYIGKFGMAYVDSATSIHDPSQPLLISFAHEEATLYIYRADPVAIPHGRYGPSRLDALRRALPMD